MLFTIVASGQSAAGWIARGTCIGSNDCLKFGHDVDILILVNKPHKFGDRIHTIKKSKAKVLTNSVAQWKPYFQNCEKIQRLISFNKLVLKNFIYSSKTSPIVCISLAVKMGATEIILWGVDFINHKSYSKGTKKGQMEIDLYKRFFKQLELKGIKVYLGAKGTAFDNYLPLWTE